MPTFHTGSNNASTDSDTTTYLDFFYLYIKKRGPIVIVAGKTELVGIHECYPVLLTALAGPKIK